MELATFLRERRSVREFENKNFSDDQISNIKNAISEVSEIYSCINLELSLNGEEIYNTLDKKAGYSGVMVWAPAYIILEYKEKDNNSILKGAYAVETLITKLQSLGISSCWLTLGENVSAEKVDLFGEERAENIDYILAIGERRSKRLFNPEPSSSRKTVEELVFTDESFKTPAIEQIKNLNMLDLFSNIRYAPSHKNKQPWKFVACNDKIRLFVQNDEDLKISLTDIGIIMYYFKSMANSMGISGDWSVNEDLSGNGEFLEIGSFCL